MFDSICVDDKGAAGRGGHSGTRSLVLQGEQVDNDCSETSFNAGMPSFDHGRKP